MVSSEPMIQRFRFLPILLLDTFFRRRNNLKFNHNRRVNAGSRFRLNTFDKRTHTRDGVGSRDTIFFFFFTALNNDIKHLDNKY